MVRRASVGCPFASWLRASNPLTAELRSLGLPHFAAARSDRAAGRPPVLSFQSRRVR